MCSVYVAFVTRNGNPPVNEITRASAAVDYARAHSVQAVLRHVPSGYGVAIGRNQAAREMFDHKGEPFTHLMFIDDDVTIPADAICRMAASGKDIICGQIPAIRIVHGLEIPYVQCMDLDGSWPHRWLLPSKDPLRIKACGFGCVMIRREVLERLGFPWFVWPDEDRHQRAMMSEDVNFCFRAAEAGYEIHVDPWIRCGHHKTLDVGSQIVEWWDVPHDVTWGGALTAAQLNELTPYASHAPVLIAIGKQHAIRDVTEFGGGAWSTRLFLSREVFPLVLRLETYESDPAWSAKIRKKVKDGRSVVIDMTLDEMPFVPANGADLVFVDCSADTVEPLDYTTRLAILERQESSGCIVVMHDTEHIGPEYCVGSDYWQQFKHVRHYDPGNKLPRTTVVSRSLPLDDLQFEPISGMELKRLTRNS